MAFDHPFCISDRLVSIHLDMLPAAGLVQLRALLLPRAQFHNPLIARTGAPKIEPLCRCRLYYVELAVVQVLPT